MSRTSAADIRAIVTQIDIEAKQAGLIPMDSRLIYSPGNSSYGHAAMIECYRDTEHGHTEIVRDASRFLPRFTYKMTKRDHEMLLEAVMNVFRALRLQREEAARERKAKGWPEDMA